MNPTALLNAMPGAVSQGLIWGIMAIGVYLTYKILDVADLTVDGTLCTGGATFIVATMAGCSIPVAMLLAFVAGLAAGLEHLNEGCPNDWNAMIDTNIKGLLYISRAVVNLMVESGIRGHIVNIGSIAGTQVYENGNVYCATKHAVHALSQGMRIDFLRQGIRVTEIRPGMVETEFSIVRFHGDKQRADGVYAGLQPLTGKDVAEAIVWATSQPDHVHINEIVLTPTAQADSFYNVRK